MNFDDPILAHREVRQALAYGTDRESLVKYLVARPGAPRRHACFRPNHWAYEPDASNTISIQLTPNNCSTPLDFPAAPMARDFISS